MTRSLIYTRFRAPFVQGALLLLTVAVALLPMLTNAHALQSGTESDPLRTELLDWSITVSGPNYTLIDVDLEEYPHGRGERIYIASRESLGFVEISFFDDADSAIDTIDLMLSDFDAASQNLEVLAMGEVSGFHFALARFELLQGPIGYFYIEVAEDIDGNVDFAQSIYTLDAEFLTQLQITQSEININGLSFLAAPVIDLQSTIQQDVSNLAATPEPVATPNHGTHVFETGETELEVGPPIEMDSPLTGSELEVLFLKSEYGYGVVGFIHQHSESASSVVSSIFVGAPIGAEAPVELYLESNDRSALGVYRVETQGETRAMVISVTKVEDGLWKVEAMAVRESEFSVELAGYQQGVTFDGEPMFADLDITAIEEVLKEHE